MNKKGLISGGMAALSVAVVLLSVSCAASVSRGGEYGTLAVALGGPRSLETGWPGATLPAFASVTVKVSAPDMSTVTATASGNEGSISLKVPAGNDRLVEIFAVPAAGGGVPFFAKSYYGSATADLEEGKQSNVSIALSLGESIIVLPTYSDTGISSLAFATSLSGDIVQTLEMALSVDSDFELDTYGRTFVSGNGLVRYTTLDDSDPLSESSTLGLAYDGSINILYEIVESNGIYPVYRDLSVESYIPQIIDQPAEVEYTDNYGLALAAGGGYVYMPVFNPTQEAYGIGKFTVTPGEQSAQANFVAFVAFNAIGIDTGSGFKVRDMIVKDEVLYVAASEHAFQYGGYPEDLISRGKVVAVSTTNLSKLWEVGYSESGLPTLPEQEFYGPARFIGVAPKKLYIADEGFTWVDTENYADPASNLDRVVEIDLETGKIMGTGLVGEASFFEDFSDVYVYGPDYGA